MWGLFECSNYLRHGHLPVKYDILDFVGKCLMTHHYHKVCNVLFYYSDPLFVFTGGTPVGYVTPDVNISLMQGKSLSMLSCDSVIVDFITVPSSPYMEGQFPVIYVCLL